MSDDKDYSALTLEELVLEEKKTKKRKLLSAAVAGFLIGIMVYGIAKNGFGFVYIFIPAMLILLIFRDTKKTDQKLQLIQAAMNYKNGK